MRRRLRLSPWFAPALFAACGGEAPWDAADWRPERPPQRIVAGSILATEVLLEIAPRERIAAVHELAADRRYSLVVAATEGLPRVGAAPEQLLAARPDLVIVDAFTRAETLALLRQAGVPVVRTRDAGSFEAIAGNVRAIGRVCHLEAPAEQLVGRLEASLRAIRTTAAEFAHWRLCGLDGALHTYGRGSLLDAVLTAAGARNLAAEHGAGAFRRVDAETVLAWRPDAIVVAAAAPGERDGEWLRQHPALRLLPCVQRGRLVAIPGPQLSTTSHHLAAAAAFVQATLRAWGRP
ncbi:MAG: ABC transporter substrate-binding protein [Planctomycetes bacterium]|nr:ABC transporter substrate-binding protein [Planctomycetota bacterium]